MFDKYEILEYLLEKSFKNEKKSYGEIYEYFQVGLKDDEEKSVTIFLNAMEDAERRIVREIQDNEIVPIYTNFIYRKVDMLPAIGFYDVFYHRNRQLYETIAGNLNVQDVFTNHLGIKKEIFDKSMKILKSDIKDRFPDKYSIEQFLAEIKMYRDI